MTEEAQRFKALEQKFDKQTCTTFYLISTKWLDKWKIKHGYGDLHNTTEHLPPINEDIAMKPKCVLKYHPMESHMWNFILRPHVKEQDYELLNQEMWKFLTRDKRVEFTLERDSYLNEQNERIVNAHLKRIRFVPFYPRAFSKIPLKDNLIEGFQYLPFICQVKDYVELLERTLTTVQNTSFLKKDSVRLYKLPADWTLERLTNVLIDKLRDHTYSKQQQIEFPEAEFLDPTTNRTFEDFQEDQILIMDAKQSQHTWMIINKKFPAEELCPSCHNYRELNVSCECKKIKYCSESCRSKDEYSHLNHCPKQEDDLSAIINLKPRIDSKMGIVGLRNLGNTCYMNGAIQCLSHAYELSRHFLDNSFWKEINYKNTLGSKGQFAKHFAYLMKRLWFDTKMTYSPIGFKRFLGEIVQLQPNFAGNNQHDAQEFLTFMLDILHEDLNRVVEKPYVEIPDGLGKEDKEIALEQWKAFKKRNDSIIVDNMYGQYKSKLECPTCHKISITFDPFLMASVSIPQVNKKFIKLTVIDGDNIWKHREELYYYDPMLDMKTKDILCEKSKLWYNCDPDDLMLTCSSLYQTEDVFPDESIHYLKKKLKQKQLFIRKQSLEELAVQPEIRMQVLTYFSYIQSGGYQWKREYIPPIYFIFSQLSSYKDVHLLYYRIFKNVFKSFNSFDPEWLNESDEVVYQKHILDNFWKLEFKSNQRYNVDCSYCYKSYCQNCPVQFTDKYLGECLERADKLIQPAIHIIFLKPFGARIEDLFDDYQKFLDPSYVAPTNDYNRAKSQTEKNYTLEHCLEYTAQPEQLSEENSWYCSNCQEHVKAFKTMHIFNTPKVLVFHLKRFKDSSFKVFKTKLQTKVVFPVDELDMTPYIQNHEGDNRYELFAICNHVGDSSAGHYTAFCKNKGEWYKFDDNYVTKTSSSVVTEQAYMLFYRRKGLDQYNLEEEFNKNYEEVKQQVEIEIEKETQLQQEKEKQQQEREKQKERERQESQSNQAQVGLTLGETGPLTIISSFNETLNNNTAQFEGPSPYSPDANLDPGANVERISGTEPEVDEKELIFSIDNQPHQRQLGSEAHRILGMPKGLKENNQIYDEDEEVNSKQADDQ